MSRAFRLGIFIVATLVILSAGVFLIGSKRFLFNSTYTLKADFQNVAGLNNGADVRVGGIHQGTVKEIDLPKRPDEKVTVVMDLAKSTQDVIKKDSVAAIKTEGLVGNKYVEISFGSQGAANVQNGDVIGAETADDMSTMTKNIEKQATAATAQATASAATFEEDMEALKHNFLLRGFFKDRGYDDASELTKNEIPRLPTGAHIKEFDYDAKRIFDKPDDAKLKHQKDLKDAGKFLEANKFGLAVVASSTSKGDTDKDRVLTEARAVVVREYLTQNFRVDDTRVKTIGLGKSTEAGENGKIQIFVYPAQRTASATKD
jgi:phospholipid/cholesterol/gamma-HCH transport system substrate-binding protein